ncbi:hypothetical protein NliqN6_4575 [Naganishia liquefaciens]|uniref:Apple domain-containing protein n=1 Tax=Naganishia liquefaciens TaxID=104408 RepID=A0A8H3TWL0_9TREE|nr:hypothetical protein NliqN6_4575 [Naganishia liquefaciens]
MHKSFAIVTLALALLQVTEAANTPTRISRSQTKQRMAQDNSRAAAPSPRDRQTNRKDIRARQELRLSPLYRRQQASAVPSLTCPATYNPTYAVARYPGIDILGGDSWPTPGPLYAGSENDCLNICLGIQGCLGYFYWAVNQGCYPKIELLPEVWSFDSVAARMEGSVTGLIGSCNAVNGAILPPFRSSCCDSPATFELPPVYDGQVCTPYVDAPLSVARMPNTDLFGYDIPADGTINVAEIYTESACIQTCVQTGGCEAYFWLPTDGACFLKGEGWGAYDFSTINAPALSTGSVTGILGTTCDDLRPRLTDEVYLRCCNNRA